MARQPLTPRVPKTGKSLDEIADMMAQNTMQMRGMTAENPDEAANISELDQSDADDDAAAGVPDTGSAEDGDEDAAARSDESDDGEAADGDEAADSDDTGTEDDEGQPNEVEDQSDGTLEEFEIDDDDLLELDDQTQVRLGDLKAAYKGNEEVARLATEQKEATTEALTNLARTVEDGQRAQHLMQEMFTQAEQVILQPLVSAPPAELKSQNPEQYIRHLEAYQQDQQRIEATRTAIQKTIEEHAKGVQEIDADRTKQEFQLLAGEIPALRSEDTEKRNAAAQDILDAGAYYGFKPEEINAAVDHRLLKMAYEAYQYRKLMDKSTTTGEQMTEEGKNKLLRQQPRTLRSRGTSAQTRLSTEAKTAKILRSKAKKSGRVEDVAALVAHNARQRRAGG